MGISSRLKNLKDKVFGKKDYESDIYSETEDLPDGGRVTRGVYTKGKDTYFTATETSPKGKVKMSFAKNGKPYDPRKDNSLQAKNPKKSKLTTKEKIVEGVKDAGSFAAQVPAHVARTVGRTTEKAVGTYSKAYKGAAKKMKRAPEGFLGFVGGVKIKKGKSGKRGVKKSLAPGMATKKETRYMERVAGQTRSTSPSSFDNLKMGGSGGDSYANAFGTTQAYSPRYPRPTNSQSVNSQYSGAFGSLQGKGRERSYQGAFGSLQGSNEPNFNGAFGAGMQGVGRANNFSGAFGSMGGKGKAFGKGRKNAFSGAFGGF